LLPWGMSRGTGMKNIVLIGFMGTGKTTVGIRLAHRLGRNFLDMDSEIERVTNKTIPQIFAQEGEVRFRSEERLVVQRLSRQKNLVIATGGGVVLNPANVADFKRNGILICLAASPEVIYERVKGKKNRPLLNRSNNLLEHIRDMLDKRRPFYQTADCTIDTNGKSREQVVEEIVAYLAKSGEMQ